MICSEELHAEDVLFTGSFQKEKEWVQQKWHSKWKTAETILKPVDA